MPNQESNHLSCGLEPRFKLLITPVTQTYIYLAESTGIEPDPVISRTHCLAGNRYHRQALLSNKISGGYAGVEPA